jgi:hypothetical protein
MKLKPQRIINSLLVAVFTVVICGCFGATLDYRDIQNDFNTAVQSDNLQSVDPFGAVNSQSLYEKVTEQLTDEYIQSLDPRLQQNAQVIRAVSLWRSGRLSEAKQAAERALHQKGSSSGPRDRMVLLMITALVNEQDLLSRYRQVPEPGRVKWNEYTSIYEKDFGEAVSTLKQAANLATPNLPQEMTFYVHFQRWRILNNWKFIISSLWDGVDPFSDPSVELRNKALAQSKNLLGGVDLIDEIEKEHEIIPQNHQLHNLMKAWMLQ